MVDIILLALFNWISELLHLRSRRDECVLTISIQLLFPLLWRSLCNSITQNIMLLAVSLFFPSKQRKSSVKTLRSPDFLCSLGKIQLQNKLFSYLCSRKTRRGVYHRYSSCRYSVNGRSIFDDRFRHLNLSTKYLCICHTSTFMIFINNKITYRTTVVYILIVFFLFHYSLTVYEARTMKSGRNEYVDLQNRMYAAGQIYIKRQPVYRVSSWHRSYIKYFLEYFCYSCYIIY